MIQIGALSRDVLIVFRLSYIYFFPIVHDEAKPEGWATQAQVGFEGGGLPQSGWGKGRAQEDVRLRSCPIPLQLTYCKIAIDCLQNFTTGRIHAWFLLTRPFIKLDDMFSLRRNNNVLGNAIFYTEKTCIRKGNFWQQCIHLCAQFAELTCLARDKERAIAEARLPAGCLNPRSRAWEIWRSKVFVFNTADRWERPARDKE